MRSRGSDVPPEIQLVSQERDHILAKYFSMFTLELHSNRWKQPAVIPT